MTATKALIECHQVFLDQGKRLVQRLTDGQYVSNQPPVYNSGVGRSYSACIGSLPGLEGRSSG